MTKPFNSMAPLSSKAYRCWVRTAMLTIATPLLLGTEPAPVSGQVWQRHTIDSSDASQGKRGADGVRLADVNQDGYLDVATGWEEGGAVTVYINPGPDNAKSTWHSVTVGSVPGVEDAVLADLDGDGAVDVISCAEGKINQVSIHWAPGNADDYLHHETWTTTPIPASQKRRWMYALPMDMNNDSRPDLVIGSKNTDAIVGWLENPKSPRLAEHWTLHELVPATWIMSLESIDMDGDGDLDILYSDRRAKDSGVYWLRNPGSADATWERKLLGGRGQEVMFLSVHRDSKTESIQIACATLNGKILHFSKKPKDAWTVDEIPLPLGLTAGKAAGLADINLDGRMDLIVTTEAQRESKDKVAVAWKENKGKGWKDHAISDLRGRKFDRFEMIDLDGDGDLDLVTCEEVHDLGLFWYENPTR